LVLEACEALDLLVDGAQRFLKDDLLRRRRTHDLGQVAAVRIVPVGSPNVVEAEPKQESLQPELCGLECDSRRVTRTAYVANRFVVDRRDVHAREISGTKEPRELDGIASVGLHAIAGLLRNEGR